MNSFQFTNVKITKEIKSVHSDPQTEIYMSAKILLNTWA